MSTPNVRRYFSLKESQNTAIVRVSPSLKAWICQIQERSLEYGDRMVVQVLVADFSTLNHNRAFCGYYQRWHGGRFRRSIPTPFRDVAIPALSDKLIAALERPAVSGFIKDVLCYPKIFCSTIQQMICPIKICDSWIRGVSHEGTQIVRSHNSFMWPPSAPVNPIL